MPQIALVGRSNVGKSSFINAVTGRRKLALVSATPGKTRLINFFCINESFLLVDLPGYGYAQVSQAERRRWGKMIEEYLLSSQHLRHLLILMDIRRDPSDDDRQMAYWAQHYRVPCTIIATKADKIAPSKRKAAAAKLSDGLGMTFATPTIVFSAQSGQGRQEALKRLTEILSAPDKP